ncbi:MAG: 2-oxoacid:acceptor oxidoreductase family protein [Deltaproteobacteria bacterium]|nr:2-oxoacid:acceptor oxidoreductase family protein [Deltaproteobacteria bacterium]
MQSEVIIAGFGGQGVMLAGQLISYAAMDAGHHVVWLPSYGPEMRGGTANCTVVISDRPIASPVVPTPGAVVVLNNPSLERFGPAVRPGGLVVINSSLVNVELRRDDVRQVKVPANAIAQECGTPKAANMVMLGAWLGASRALAMQAVKDMIVHKFGHKEGWVELNHRALDRGWSLAAGEDAA